MRKNYHSQDNALARQRALETEIERYCLIFAQKEENPRLLLGPKNESYVRDILNRISQIGSILPHITKSKLIVKIKEERVKNAIETRINK